MIIRPRVGSSLAPETAQWGEIFDARLDGLDLVKHVRLAG